MSSLVNHTALVTGASAGIGKACARLLASRGARVVAAARREERLEALKGEAEEKGWGRVYPVTLDVRDRDAADALASRLAEEGWSPDILLNNAGKARGLAPVQEGGRDDWEEMIDTNVKGLLWMTRAFLPAMVEAGRGHVVNIGSIAGRQVYPNGNVYNATKFAVRALTEAISVDLVGTPVRVSSIDPGLVETEFSEVRFHGDTERAEKVYQGYEPLRAEDIAEAVLWVLERPAHVNILEMLVLPTDQRNAYVLYRNEEGGGQAG